MTKQLLKTLAVMAVLLSLAAVPAMAATTNGPILGTEHFTGQIDKIDPTTGWSFPIFGVYSDANTESALSVTPDGNTVVYSGKAGGYTELFSVPLDGSAAPTQLTSTAGEYESSIKRDPVVSPDGQTVYFNWGRRDSAFNYQSGLYSVPIGGGEPTPIAEGGSRSGMKITPDGQYLVYVATDPEAYETKTVEAIPVDGGPTHTVVDNTQVADFAGFGSLSISPDGKTVAMTGRDRKGFGSTSLYTAPFSTTSTTQATVLSGTTVRPWQNDRTYEQNGLVSLAFSPDGRSIAYNLWTNANTGYTVEEIRSVPATGGTPTVIVPEITSGSSNGMHSNLVWAPQVVTSTVPEVVATDPIDGATEVPRTIIPTVTFNTELDASTVNTQNFRLEVYNTKTQKWAPVTSTPSFYQDTKTIAVTPARSLGSQKEYRVRLSTGIKSSTGEALASPYSWSFTTAP